MEEGEAPPRGGLDRLIRALGLIGGGALVFMVLLTVVDVTLRKLWNAPIFGALDIHRMTLLTVVFLAIPPILVFITGMIFVPLSFRWSAKASQRETATLIAARSR